MSKIEFTSSAVFIQFLSGALVVTDEGCPSPAKEGRAPTDFRSRKEARKYVGIFSDGRNSNQLEGAKILEVKKIIYEVEDVTTSANEDVRKEYEAKLMELKLMYGAKE